MDGSQKEQHLYVFGYTKHGQCGLADQENILTPKLLPYFEEKGIEIEELACGGTFSMVTTADGEIYEWGDNRSNQPRNVASLRSLKFLQIRGGAMNTLALSTGGAPYSWGTAVHPSNMAVPQKPVLSPPQCISSRTFQSIAVGSLHFLALTEWGGLWFWGDNSKSQCGVPSKSQIHVKEPTQHNTNPFQANLRAVACGGHHSVAVDRNGDVYAWGDNKYGQCGLPPSEIQEVETPTRLHTIKGAQSVTCGDYHTFILMRDHTVLAFGKNDKGQLGLGHTDKGLCTLPFFNFCQKSESLRRIIFSICYLIVFPLLRDLTKSFWYLIFSLIDLFLISCWSKTCNFS